MKNYKKKIMCGILRAPRFLICAAFLGGSAMAFAGPLTAQHPDRQFSKKSGDIVNKAMILADAMKYEAALNDLNKLIDETDLNPYERSTIYQMMGQYSYEVDRTASAILAFENAISSGGLKADEARNLDVVIGQLMIGEGQYKAGVERLETYLVAGSAPDSKYVDLLLNGWMQAEDYPRALPWAKKWFENAEPKQRKHYDLLNFLYQDLGMKAEQTELTKEMMVRWPEDNSLPSR